MNDKLDISAMFTLSGLLLVRGGGNCGGGKVKAGRGKAGGVVGVMGRVFPTLSCGVHVAVKTCKPTTARTWCLT